LSTGSVYKDYALLKNGFPGESVANGSVAVIKTHEFGPKDVAAFDKAILLVREPFSALRAEFNRLSGGHIGHASSDKYKRHGGRYWRTFVAEKAAKWQQLHEAWWRGFDKSSMLVIRYEDLVADVAGQLRRVLDFLGQRDEAGEQCAVSRKEGIYKRKPFHLDFDVFDANMRADIRRRMSQVYPMLALETPSGASQPPSTTTTSSASSTSTKSTQAFLEV
jgi:hypothetical protein